MTHANRFFVTMYLHPKIVKLAKRYPKYLQEDLILEGSLYAKCYRGRIEAFPFLLKLHMSRIASELREVAITMNLEDAEKAYNLDPWAFYKTSIEEYPSSCTDSHPHPQPSLREITQATQVTSRMAYRIRNHIETRRVFLP